MSQDFEVDVKHLPLDFVLDVLYTQLLIFCHELRHAALSLVHLRIIRSHAGKQKNKMKEGNLNGKWMLKTMKKRLAEDGVKVGKNVKKGIEKMRARIGKESGEKRRREVVKKIISYQSVRVMLSEGLNGERNHYRKRELHELIGTITVPIITKY